MGSKVKHKTGPKAGMVEKTVRFNSCGKESEVKALKKIAKQSEQNFSKFIMQALRERHLEKVL